MRINSKSLHYSYFIFLKRFESALHSVMESDNNNPLEHYNYFTKIIWISKLCDKYNIPKNFEYNFENIKDHFKRMLNKMIVYQLWGSSVILFLYMLALMLLSLESPSIVSYLISGIFPIFSILLIFGLFSNIIEFLKMFGKFIKGKVELNKRVNLKYKTIFPYLLYILFAPLIFFFAMFIEIFTRFIISSIYYLYMGVILFIENIALVITFIFQLLFIILTKFKNYLKRQKPTGNHSFVKRLVLFELKEN